MRPPNIYIRPGKLLAVEIDPTSPIRKYQQLQVFLGFKLFDRFQYEIVVVG